MDGKLPLDSLAAAARPHPSGARPAQSLIVPLFHLLILAVRLVWGARAGAPKRGLHLGVGAAGSSLNPPHPAAPPIQPLTASHRHGRRGGRSWVGAQPGFEVHSRRRDEQIITADRDSVRGGVASASRPAKVGEAEGTQMETWTQPRTHARANSGPSPPQKELGGISTTAHTRPGPTPRRP